ncbi:hypothetical protein Lal_00009327 [Lupinus albus]|uniref:Putative transcription factor homeobox-WOX family n=1 Tax=Lupinus albus TaxID=3870 RepID=A0A6A4P0R7_LUPAL|nr:putative transcription factor homeobox-WOX family [Lupinus albus]KAF1862944.1 hypothetical protein Lal_00009327 [Lupinus albus]
MMEWQKKEMMMQQNGNEMMYVKVMSDEQLETLRKQIAVYATICEQLIQMHNTLSTHQNLSGIRVGNMYCDPLMNSIGHKLTSRQRWTPTPMHLQVLERVFEQGIGTPSKEKIKEITADLIQHGQISETNVYNWFQNRRARSKRKQQQQNFGSSNAESEVDTEVDSKEKKTKAKEFQSQHRVTTGVFQNPQVSYDLQYLNSESNEPDSMFPPEGNLSPSRNFSDVPVFDGMLSNSRSDYLAGKFEEPESFNLYQPTGDYNMAG